MYCPSCKAEFIDSITICSDCNITLVDNMVLNESLENINWVKVKELPGKVFGEMMGEVLDSAEIPYFLKYQIKLRLRDMHFKTEYSNQ